MSKWVKRVLSVVLVFVLIGGAVPLGMVRSDAAGTEKAIFPMAYMRISQGPNGSYSHKGSNAVDNGGKDNGIDDVFAPFTGTIKRVPSSSYNVVWLESNNPVQYADGTVDYMTIMMEHANDASNLWAGKVINQGEVFYHEGTANTSTNHLHFECGKGRFSGTGWYQNSHGNWTINNSYSPTGALYLDTTRTTVLNDGGLSWVRIDGTVKKPTWATLSISKTVLNSGDTVAFYCSSDRATGYTIGIDSQRMDGSWERIHTGDIYSGWSPSFIADGNYTGNLSAYVTAGNSAGRVDSDKVYFSIKPPAPVVSTNKSIYALNENISISWTRPGASSYGLAILKDDGTKPVNQIIGGSGANWSAAAGEYTIYVEASNNAGSTLSAGRKITVGSKYTLTYNANGGSGAPSSTQQWEYRTFKMSATRPTRAGYAFLGWALSSAASAKEFDPSQEIQITGNVTAYAVWKANSYSVKYNANGGSGTMANSSHTYDASKNLTANVFIRANHTFAGWATSSGGSVVYANQASVRNLSATDQATVSLYAVWTQIPTATVTYNYAENGGSSATKTNVTANVGSPVDLTPTATKSGWTFVGWNTNKDATTALSSLAMGSSNVMLYAIYKKTLTGTFVDYSVTTKTTRAATVTIYNKATNGSVTAPTQNTYTGWTSRGWSTSTTTNAPPVTSFSIAADATFYGLYQRTLTLSYNTNGGTSTPSSQTGIQYVNSNTITLYSNPSFVLTGAITHPTYIFNKWRLGSVDGFLYNPGDSVVIDTNTVVYATWIDTATTSYSIVFYANGGSSAPGSAKKSHNDTITLPTGVPWRNGYNFIGWAKTRSATTPDYLPGDSYSENADCTFYAVWQAAPAISLNTSTEVPYPFAGLTIYYSFTPTQSGKYVFYSSGEFAPVAGVYNEQGNSIDYNSFQFENSQFFLECELNAGTPYYFLVGDVRSKVGSFVVKLEKRIDYEVVFNSNGGTGVMTNSAHTYHLQQELPQNMFAREGYTFSGWATSVSGPAVYADGQDVKNLSAIDGDKINLYAVWQQNAPTSYSLTLNADGGTVTPTTVTQAAGTNYSLPIPARSDYTFTGWALSGGGGLSGITYTFGTSNGTVTAQWTANVTNSTLTLNPNGGSVTPTSVTQATGTNYTLPTPTLSGYTFTGWTLSGGGDLSGDVYYFGTSNGTVTAQWAANVMSYTLTLNPNGGSVMPTSLIQATGETCTLPTPSRNGYTFTGWTLSGGGSLSGEVYAFGTSNGTVTAQWTATTYTLTLNPNGGSVTPTTITQATGYVYTLPTPTRSDYTFAGWTFSGDGSLNGNVYTFGTSNGTVTAQWTASSYTLTYNANSGTGAPAAQTFKPGDTLIISSTMPMRSGFTFVGWAKTSDASDIAVGGSYIVPGDALAIDGNIDLYAVWMTLKPYVTVVYNANGGMGSPPNEQQELYIYYPVSKTAPTRSGYVFLGWADSSDALEAKYLPEATWGWNGRALQTDLTGVRYAVWVSLASVKSDSIALDLGYNTDRRNIYYKFTPTITGDYSFAVHHEGNLSWTYTQIFDDQGICLYSGSNRMAAAMKQTLAAGKTYYVVVSASNSSVDDHYVSLTGPTFTISYDANGGSGAPDAQTKTYGTTLNLSSTRPTRSGYTFQGWATSNTATTTAYQPNGNYTAEASVMLYAIWSSGPSTNTYALTVNSGSGSGNYAANATVTITANAAPLGRMFDKWTTSDGVSFVNANASTTTFTMPSKNVSVTATYKDAAKKIFSTKYDATFLNYILFFVCFGFIWMWF